MYKSSIGFMPIFLKFHLHQLSFLSMVIGPIHTLLLLDSSNFITIQESLSPSSPWPNWS